jgi:hypothetical protein
MHTRVGCPQSTSPAFTLVSKARRDPPPLSIREASTRRTASVILGGLSQIAGLVISFGESSSEVRLLRFRRYPNPVPFLGGADIGREILTTLVEVN